MSEAEKRVSELLDRWLSSLELHSRYLKLDDAEYARVQAWPKHQRPNKWIIDLARQRVGELKHHLEERREIGDDEFADALELMGFLTSLLATEHLERFVPLALPQKEARDTTVRRPALREAGETAPGLSCASPRCCSPPRAGAAPCGVDERRAEAARVARRRSRPPAGSGVAAGTATARQAHRAAHQAHRLRCSASPRLG